LAKLPLFVTCRYPATKQWWERGVVNRCADNGDNFSQDAEFLKACLIYTSLSRHNKCLSFNGSDGVQYRNELCFDTGTVASAELAKCKLTAVEQALIDQWHKVLAGAEKTAKYDPQKTYGLYQIDVELNTMYKVPKANTSKMETVFDYPELNGDIKTLKALLARYHADVITPKLWSYGLLK
jgi:hypothetical protein